MRKGTGSTYGASISTFSVSTDSDSASTVNDSSSSSTVSDRDSASKDSGQCNLPVFTIQIDF